MKITIDRITFNLIVDTTILNQSLTPIIFLHGFTGAAINWKFIFDKLPDNFLPVAIDLTGHGQSDSPHDVSFYTSDAQIKQLKGIVDELKLSQFVLCGYSMGGRLALSFALKYPGLINKFILESTSPGLPTKNERAERINSDKSLADRIENEGVEKFVDYWMNIPLFNSLKNLPDEKYIAIVNQKRDNNATGLANSLRGFSTGLMPDYRDALKNFDKDTLLITGSEDTKYCLLNYEMAELLPNAVHKIINGSGHNAHLENPEDFIILVNQFLSR